MKRPSPIPLPPSRTRPAGLAARRWLWLVPLVLATTTIAHAQQPPTPATEEERSQVPPPRETYLGRRIATTMHYTGAEWLIRDEREREERCSLMLANLGVKRGMTICDMGCGNGYYSLQLARMVGPEGRVLAVDIQPQMLYFLRQRMEKSGVANVTPILGSLHDPRLPRRSADLILLVDVYHEFSHPEQMLSAMRDALNPGGRLVLVEYREEDPEVPIKPLHKMSKQQVDKELAANGFQLVEQFDGLPWQHMLFYAPLDDTPGEDGTVRRPADEPALPPESESRRTP